MNDKLNYVKAVTDILELKLRSESASIFVAGVKEIAEFQGCVTLIEKVTTSWAKKVGLLEKKEPVKTDLSSQETVWKTYFRDHGFKTMEDARNMADALSIITGIDVNRFLISEKSANPVGSFPTFVCIIPLEGFDGSNYKNGEAIMATGTGTVFVRHNGQTGNNLGWHLDQVKLPSRDEIQNLIAKIMCHNSSYMERILSFSRNYKDIE